MVDDVAERDSRSGGVQSLARAFRILEAIADRDGSASITELAAACDLPVPTIHRLLRSLAGLGYARQEPSRTYALGPRLVRLGDVASRLVNSWANPHLRVLSDRLGESANFALMDGLEVIYVAQAPGRHGMRMFTEVGHRADLHCTAVGKAILATHRPDAAAELMARLSYRTHTVHTIASAAEMAREIERVRVVGYATDINEQEVGVSCVAVALPGSPARGAVSISAPSTRLTEETIAEAVPLLKAVASALGGELERGL
ncbi:MAG: IclR family transcriptional regulator [Microbacterium sp.]|uniref:IclR family transcriptional regulator n=1 Tax=Microbacterium sp. TaxID=51671 RepID=UPI0039E2B989